MSNVTTTCRCCGREIAFPEEAALWNCAACGTLNARPQAEGPTLDALRRATQQRLRCDFQNAEISYQHVLRDYPDEHEALWGLALCRYGVEYVDDPRTGKRMPTVHSVRKKPMQRDGDYLSACNCAPDSVRQQYEAEAQYIDDAMARIRKLAETQSPYDVFICHKTTVPGSDNYTRESMQASEMAHQLEKQGYRVFFAPEAMKGEVGADYEAAIYHALDTAKVMLLFCATPEYVNSAWVRSEWLRFLEMVDVREDKRLVPLLYGDFTVARLPQEIRAYRLECVTMDSWTAASDVLNVLEKCCGKRGAVQEKPVEEMPAPAKPEPEKPATVQPVVEKKPAPAKPAVIYAWEAYFETEPADGGCCITDYMGDGGDVEIPPVIEGCRVVAIGDEAFKECSSLTSITIPDSVTSIGDSAFEACDSLTSITIPDSVMSIGGWAFAGCDSLTSITIPDSVTSIGDWTFSGCSSLTSITIPDSVTSMGGNPFAACNSLKEIAVDAGNSMYYVRDNVLMSNKKELVCYPAGLAATHYTIPKDVTSIGESAFGGCDRLTSITISNSVPIIGSFAFADCKSLTSITIPDSVTSIGEDAFADCPNLTLCVHQHSAAHAYAQNNNVRFELVDRAPEKPAPAKPVVEKKPAPAKPAVIYASEADFETEPADGGCCIKKYKGAGGAVHIAPMIGGRRVVAIGDEAFERCSGLTSITIPDSVTSIGDSAFWGCSSLTSITIPDGVTSIRESAFYGCSGLTSVSIPKGVTSVEGWAFDRCSSLTSITIPDSVTSIGDWAFNRCSSLTSITIPDSVRRIEEGAFWGCTSLTSVTLPSSVKLGKNVFDGCPWQPPRKKLFGIF